MPKILSVVLALLAVLCATAAISQAVFHRVQPLRYMIDNLLLPAPANLGYAAFVTMLAAGVARRKRVAWVFLVIYFGLQFVADAVLLAVLQFPPGDAIALSLPRYATWLNSANLVITAAVLAILVLARGQFFAQVQQASLRRAIAVLLSLLGIGVALGWGLVSAFPGTLRSGGDRFTYATEKVLGGAFVFDFTRRGSAPGWVTLLLGLLGGIALFTAMGVLFRSQQLAAALTPDDERRIRALLAESGESDSLGYFSSRRDKAVVFSPSGKAAVTFRVHTGVALASADPIGDQEAWAPAIDAFLNQAAAYAWTPAVMGASEAGATAYARAGLRALELGDEAIVHVGEFTLDGRDMRPVRQAVNRVERAGYELRIRRHVSISTQEMARIISLADTWRDTETERGFSMALGRLGDSADGECMLVEACDRYGREAGLLSFTPWGRHGLSLDLMRRDRLSDNGLIEFMVAGLIHAAPDFGIERISLNFAVFRSVFEEGARIGAGPVLRMWRRLLLFFSRWYQLESLYRSNVKYRPEWVPRFLCYEDSRDLATVALASGIAEGFVVVPSLATLFRRGLSAPPVTTPVPAAPNLASPPAAALPRAQPAVPEQVRVRLAKLEALRDAGVDPYPPDIRRTHSCAAVRSAYAELAPGAMTGEQVTVAGRVVLLRNHGALCFATLRDWSGDLQVMLPKSRTGGPSLDAWKSTVDLGDHVAVTGEIGASKRGEVSVLADSWQLAAKCLHPLPDKHRGLADPEAKVRARHLDLMVNPSARSVLRLRGAVLDSLRDTLTGRGFLEVETPVLQAVHGGANARPFKTHSNAYDLPLYLRIAPELYLKRLAVGGVERLFELGRTFRNEGVDATHNPEFTMLECYQAYADYTDMRELTCALIVAAATEGLTAPVCVGPDGTEVDLAGEWPVVSVHDAIALVLGEVVTPDTPIETLRKLAATAGVSLEPQWSLGQVVLEMYERLVERTTKEPTFYVDFPTEVSPLTRQHRLDPRLAERWDLVAFGVELGTAYTELIDPVEQRRRLTEQSLQAAGGDPEAMQLDEAFLAALEYAMPPTGGLGLGVDRLIMLLAGGSIRETLTFPLVRPDTTGSAG